MKAVTSLLVALFLATPLAASAADAKWGEVDREEFFNQYFPEAPKADAVVLLDQATVRVDKKNRLKVNYHHRTRVMTDAGTDRGVMRIPFGPGDEIKSFRAQTIVPPGHLVKVEGDHIEKREGQDGGEWIITFPQVAKGVVLEYEYELRRDRLDQVPRWDFRNADFTRRSELLLQLPAEISHEAFFGWTPGIAPRPESTKINDPEDSGRELNQWTWSVANQDPVPDLPFLWAPEEYQVTLHVQLREIVTPRKTTPILRSWEQIGAEAGEMVAAVAKDSNGVKDFAKGAASGQSGKAAAEAIYRAVQQNIQIIEPKWEKDGAQLGKILAAGQGTPKQTNLLFARALKEAGINAAVVLTPSDRSTQDRWRSLEQFDHAVVRIEAGGEVIWADASAHGCPFGWLPLEARAKQGLLAGGGLIAIEAPSVSSERVVSTEGVIAENGTLEATVQLQFAGHPAVLAHRSLAQAGEREFVTSLLRERFGAGCELVSHEMLSPAGDASKLDLKVTYRVAEWTKPKGQRYEGALPWLFAVAENPLAVDDRDIPVDFGYTGETRESVKITMPDGMFVVSVPQRKSARMAEMNFKATYAMDRTVLESTREVNVRRSMVETVDYPKLRELWDQVAAADAAKFTVGRQAMRPASGTR